LSHPPKVIEPASDGGFTLRLSSPERHLLRELPAELDSMLELGADDPSLRRLFPPAYAEDAGADAEYRELMHADLLGSHRQALTVLQETAGSDRLEAAEVHAWLVALNDLRLVLGTRLDVTEDLYEGEIDPEDAELGVYLYLTWLQEQFVEAAGEAASSATPE
jgi:Domain of unknown function (DUF2017)